MYAICSTRKGHVRKYVDEMKEKGYSFTVFQFKADEHDRLSKVRGDVEEITGTCNKVKCEHVINIKTGTLHRPSCKMAGKVVEAYVINPKATGLKICRCARK